MSSALLPPNSTPLMRSLADLGAKALDLPIILRTLWNPDACPVHLLPYLAWAFSVDRWDASWPEDTKRAVIKAAYAVHQRKGTVGAIRRVVEVFGYQLNVIEWWETDPPGPRGTFRIEVAVLDEGISPETYAEVERLVNDAKPLARHLVDLAVAVEPHGAIWFAMAIDEAEIITVYPLEP